MFLFLFCGNCQSLSNYLFGARWWCALLEMYTVKLRENCALHYICIYLSLMNSQESAQIETSTAREKKLHSFSRFFWCDLKWDDAVWSSNRQMKYCGKIFELKRRLRATPDLLPKGLVLLMIRISQHEGHSTQISIVQHGCTTWEGV